MTTANGIDSLLVIGKQPAEGTKALAANGRLYPRVTATFDTDADKYSSAEIDPSQQQSDTRLGNFRTSGAIKGEASCGTYTALLAALLRRSALLRWLGSYPRSKGDNVPPAEFATTQAYTLATDQVRRWTRGEWT